MQSPPSSPTAAGLRRALTRAARGHAGQVRPHSEDPRLRRRSTVASRQRQPREKRHTRLCAARTSSVTEHLTQRSDSQTMRRRSDWVRARVGTGFVYEPQPRRWRRPSPGVVVAVASSIAATILALPSFALDARELLRGRATPAPAVSAPPATDPPVTTCHASPVSSRLRPLTAESGHSPSRARSRRRPTHMPARREEHLPAPDPPPSERGIARRSQCSPD